jgi:hypothetical protein
MTTHDQRKKTDRETLAHFSGTFPQRLLWALCVMTFKKNKKARRSLCHLLKSRQLTASFQLKRSPK